MVAKFANKLPLLLACAAVLSLPCYIIAEDDNAPNAAKAWQAPERASKKKNPVAADAKSLEQGKTLYAKNCLSCHGDAGKGDGPAAKALDKKPDDLTTTIGKQTDGALFWKITEGHKPMPSYEKLLTDDERWHVVNYVRTLGSDKKEK